MSPDHEVNPSVVGRMSADERLELIADLLSYSPTSSGVFGRESAAAAALARGEDIDTLIVLLGEAERVGSRAATECLARLPLTFSID